MTKTNEIRKLAAQAAVLFTAAILAASELQAQTAPAPRRQIIISLADRKLALLENGEVTHVFPIAVGKDSTPSPTGSFQIVNRVVNPTYYHEHKAISGALEFLAYCLPRVRQTPHGRDRQRRRHIDATTGRDECSRTRIFS